MSKQSTSHLFMIEPESFYSNEKTAFTNHYQEQVTDETPEIIAEKALLEFHALKNAIEDGQDITYKNINGEYFDCGTPEEYLSLLTKLIN